MADGGFDVDKIDVSLETYGRGIPAPTEKLNHSNPLRTPDGLAFPLPSAAADWLYAGPTLRHIPDEVEHGIKARPTPSSQLSILLSVERTLEIRRLSLGTRDTAITYLATCTGHYVYLFRRPPDGRPFYVGKGQGARVFQHENEARHPGNHPKLNVIRAIWKQGESVQYEIDSVFPTAEEAYTREAVLILAYKRLHEGGPLTKLAPGGGTDAGISPISREKHRISLGGIPEDDRESATMNRYLLSIGEPRSICVKLFSRFRAKVKPAQAYPDKKVGKSSRQAYALVASAAANSIMLEPRCVIPRLFTIEGIEGIMENGVCCDFVTSGMAELVPNPIPRLESFRLNSSQIATVRGFIGREKLRDLGLVS